MVHNASTQVSANGAAGDVQLSVVKNSGALRRQIVDVSGNGAAGYVQRSAIENSAALRSKIVGERTVGDVDRSDTGVIDCASPGAVGSRDGQSRKAYRAVCRDVEDAHGGGRISRHDQFVRPRPCDVYTVAY